MSVFLKRPSPFAADEWNLIPYEHITQNAFDSLFTIILHVPSCQFLYSQLPATSSDSSALENEKTKIAKEAIIAKCMEIMLKLDDYWVTCFDRFNEEPIHDHTSSENPSAIGAQFFPSKGCEHEGFAYYASARIILNSLLALTSPNRKIQQMYEEQVLRYSAKLLSQSALEREIKAALTGKCLMGSPLRVICEYSPCSVQRQEARDILARWERRRDGRMEQKSVILA